MRYQQYKFKFYLDASHAIYIDGTMGERHPHTWEIAVNILKMRDGFVQFSQLEQKISRFFDTYQEKFINEIPPFTTLNPTLENCCTYFKERLTELLNADGWVLMMIEMSETPTRSYVINCLDEGGVEAEQTAEAVADAVLTKVRTSIENKRIVTNEET